MQHRGDKGQSRHFVDETLASAEHIAQDTMEHFLYLPFGQKNSPCQRFTCRKETEVPCNYIRDQRKRPWGISPRGVTSCWTMQPPFYPNFPPISPTPFPHWQRYLEGADFPIQPLHVPLATHPVLLPHIHMTIKMSFNFTLGRVINIHKPVKSLFFFLKFRNLVGPCWAAVHVNEEHFLKLIVSPITSFSTSPRPYLPPDSHNLFVKKHSSYSFLG